MALLSYGLALAGLGGSPGSRGQPAEPFLAARGRARPPRQDGARRRTPGRDAGDEGAPAVTGSPFLEGQTVSIAEAALQQRVGGAVTAAGGNVLSSQVEPEGGETRKDYLTLIASCDIDQQGLQPLLYDLEPECRSVHRSACATSAAGVGVRRPAGCAC